MKDRISLYPGRVKLTPVAGEENTFDMVRADQPTQEGTVLNKANLLSDETAALYGKNDTTVPDDILNLLAKAAIIIESSSNITNEVDEKTLNLLTAGVACKLQPIWDESKGEYVPQGDTVELSGGSSESSTFTTLGATWAWKFNSTASGTDLYGYYIEDSDKTRFYVAGDTTYSNYSGQNVLFTSAGNVTIRGSSQSLTDVLGNHYYGDVQFATGAYAGTGTNGKNKPNRLTFEFEPKFVLILNKYGKIYETMAVLKPMNRVYVYDAFLGSDYYDYIYFDWNGKSVSWYSLDNSMYQLNSTNMKYYYLAIG